MANKSISMIDIRQIIRLGSEQESKSEISRMVGVSRKTVSRYLALAVSAGINYSDIEDKSDEEIQNIIHKQEEPTKTRYADLANRFHEYEMELTKTGVNKFLLWEEYKEEFSDGYNYTQFCKHLKAYLQKNEAVMHFEHKAGDKMFIDYTGHKLNIIDPETGHIREMEVFIAVLGMSGKTYVEATESQKKEDFIRAVENALHFYGGCPKAIVPDNLKSAVTKASNYEAVLNEDFKRFCLHYNTATLAARSRRPRDKALVEKAVSTVYTRIFAKLRKRTFHNLTDLNEAVLELLNEHNRKNYQGRDYSRQDMFENIEKQALSPLPPRRYELTNYKYLTVNKNCHIYLTEDKHYYSAPYQYIGKKLKVIYSKSYVEIYHGLSRIAFHKRDYRNYIYTTVRSHMPSAHQFVSDWNPKFFISWAKGVGGDTEEYIKVILDSKQHPEQAYKSCIGILKYAEKYDKDRLNTACRRAADYNSFSYTTIRNILSKGIDLIKDEEENQLSLPLHDNIRGESYYLS